MGTKKIESALAFRDESKPEFGVGFTRVVDSCLG
jgi:hypothetical protein